MANQDSNRFVSLDGWRGISILLVLASHLLPLGARETQNNLAVGLLGMSFFFTLSGFLMTQFLLTHTSTVDFLIRRFFRIIPLAWSFMGIVLLWEHASLQSWFAHFFFYANLTSPSELTPTTAHLWSLCMEVQFYAVIALLHLFLRQRGMWLLPVMCVGFTLFRVYAGIHYSPVTWYRVDEILAGSTLALIYHYPKFERVRRVIARINPFFVLPFLLLSCHPIGDFLTYLRPYFGLLLVATTLFNRQSRLTSALDNRLLVYVASISYALYVIHPALADTWFGSGDDPVEKYLKRPLLFGVLFLLAHASTRYLEQPCIRLGKRLSARLRATPEQPPATSPSSKISIQPVLQK